MSQGVVTRSQDLQPQHDMDIVYDQPQLTTSALQVAVRSRDVVPQPQDLRPQMAVSSSSRVSRSIVSQSITKAVTGRTVAREKALQMYKRGQDENSPSRMMVFVEKSVDEMIYDVLKKDNKSILSILPAWRTYLSCDRGNKECEHSIWKPFSIQIRELLYLRGFLFYIPVASI